MTRDELDTVVSDHRFAVSLQRLHEANVAEVANAYLYGHVNRVDLEEVVTMWRDAKAEAEALRVLLNAVQGDLPKPAEPWVVA